MARPRILPIATLCLAAPWACSDGEGDGEAPSATGADAASSRGRLPAAAPLAQRAPGLQVVYRDAAGEVPATVPAPRGHLPAGHSPHPAVDPVFEARYLGQLKVGRPGRHELSFPGTIRIDGHEVRGEVDLAAGWHELELELRRAEDQPFSHVLEWSGPRFEREPVPPRAFSHDASKTLEPAWSGWERGRASMREHSCTACHASENGGPGSRAGPVLSLAGDRLDPDWIHRWLSARPGDEHWPSWRRMPAVPLDASQRADVVAYLRGLRSTPETPPPREPSLERGEQDYHALGCAACHEGEDARPHPIDLAHKTSLAALSRTLLDPHAVFADGRMPALLLDPTTAAPEPDRAADLAAFLIDRSRRRLEEAGHAPPPAAPPGDPARGERWIQDFGCLACHTLEPTPAQRIAARGAGPAELSLGAWQQAGPVPHEGAFLRRRSFEPALLAQDSVETDAGPLSWTPAALVDGQAWTAFAEQQNSLGFLRRSIEAPEATVLVLEVECDDQICVELDGEVLHESTRNSFGKPVELRTSLDAGRHQLFLRLGNDSGRWRHRLRLRTEPAWAREALRIGGRGPALATLEPGAGCLDGEAAADSTRPRYALDDAERAAIGLALELRKTRPREHPAPAFELRPRLQELRCVACHEMDEIAASAGLNERPPPLSVVGDKLRTSWFEDVLLHHRRVRPWLDLRMPDYADDAVRALPTWFALDAGLPPGEGESPAYDHDQRRQGVELLGKGGDGLACISCHDYKEYKALGTRGPGLTEMDARIRPDWMQRWLMQPFRVIPGTSMPNNFSDLPPAERDRQITAVRAALAMREHLSPPAGLRLDSDARDLLPTHRPLVQRTFMPDAGPAAIALALPGLINLCWDSDPCRPRYVWEGDFLDMRPAWRKKGETLPTLLGRRFLELPEDLGIHGPEGRGAWRYRGYRRVESSIELHSRWGELELFERPAAAEGGLGLRIDYHLPRAPEGLRWRCAPVAGQQVSCSLEPEGEGSWRIPAGEELRFHVAILADPSSAETDR